MGKGSQPAPQATQPITPPPRNIGDEFIQTVGAYKKTAPDIYELESSYRPKYAALDNKIIRESLTGDEGLLNLFQQISPQVSALDAGVASAQRTADIADLERLGPRAMDALRLANPQQTKLLDFINSDSMTGIAGSEIEGILKQQALEDLRNNGMLSPDEERDIQQYTRAQFQQKGLSNSTPELFTEALNRSEYRNARRREGQTFAQGVDQYITGKKDMDRAYRGNVANLNQAVFDPMFAILARPGSGTAGAQSLFSQAGYGLNSRPSMFNPESAYASDLYNTNYNAQAAANIAAANNAAAMFGANKAARGSLIGGGIQAFGSLGGAAIMAA